MWCKGARGSRITARMAGVHVLDVCIRRNKCKKKYKYGNTEHKLTITKVIFADDGTYLSHTRSGAQRVLTAVAYFSTATGIKKKPPKSYTYSNRPGKPLYITTYEQSDTNFKLRGKQVTELVELQEEDYFRHLGNIQNAQGSTPVKPAQMYDGSTQENIFSKVSKSMSSLATRNITIGGCMQVLQAVVVRQILYPTIFGNMNAAMINTMQNKIQAVIKNKLRYHKHMKNEVL